MPTSGNSKSGSTRGFASMDAEQQRAIASRGGRAAHEQGTAHQFSSEEARAAGRKGGQAAHQSGKAHQFTSEEARAAGRKGGHASHGGKRGRVQQDVHHSSGADLPQADQGSVARSPRETRETND